jgi:uncharacterized membrane protein YeaQ/YmgE (transglycosylase-associated protein family)
MDMVGVIISLISGAAGGNIAGAALKDQSLGTVGNSIAGILGRDTAASARTRCGRRGTRRWISPRQYRKRGCGRRHLDGHHRFPEKRDGESVVGLLAAAIFSRSRVASRPQRLASPRLCPFGAGQFED